MLKQPEQAHVVTAGDVTATEILFQFDYANVAYALVEVQTAAGAAKAWDGAITISGNTVTVDNTGATDFAATDVVFVRIIPDTAVV
jgi:riboflavin synthase alpha subunit